jgi:hypothetical protein
MLKFFLEGNQFSWYNPSNHHLIERNDEKQFVEIN